MLDPKIEEEKRDVLNIHFHKLEKIPAPRDTCKYTLIDSCVIKLITSNGWIERIQ